MSVYKITNNLNGKAYIGQTINSIQERFRTHCGVYSEGKCPALWSAIQRHGKDNFTIEVLWSEAGCTKEELDKKEIEMIAVHNTRSPNGYNLMEGGHSSRHHEESRKKISDAKKKLWEEKGDEIRAKIRERGVSEETRNRMSEGCIRKYQERPELKEYTKSREGTTHTEETRAKMVEAWKRRREKPEYSDTIEKANASKCKKVYVFDENRILVHVFDSLAQAAQHDVSFTKGGISTALKNGSFYRKQYYFSYTEEPPAPKEKIYKHIYCFDHEGTLIDVCKSLEEIHEKTGFSASGVLALAIKRGQLYKGQYYFSYSSTLPLVST